MNGGSDEFMLGAGFKQSTHFNQGLSEEAAKYHQEYPEAPNALKNKHIYEIVTCAMQMAKNMPSIRDWYIRKFYFTDECDFSNYFTKNLKQACTEYLR